MYLIDLVKPSILVELGTYRGVSYCAFCQAVEILKLNSRCFAVDTWSGDSQTGYYGKNILDELTEHHDPLYGHFSKLIRGTFENAALQFEDGVIDLLHIDGLHTYEAVCSDFETWLPKMSDQGVILFHDISVRDPGFGVWKFWDELKSKYTSFELPFGNGLGLIVVDKVPDGGLGDLLTAPAQVKQNISLLFERLGSRLELRYHAELLSQKSAQLEQMCHEQAEGIDWLHGQLEEHRNLSQSRSFRLYRNLRLNGFGRTAKKIVSRIRP